LKTTGSHKILGIEHANEKALKQQAVGNEGEQIEEKGKRMVAEVNNSLAREKANTKKILRDTEEQATSKIKQVCQSTVCLIA
jgi:HPt (histidine-containing phosphotransfer) domain-containing protein